MRDKLMSFMKKRKWHNKIAKTRPRTQSLFEHSLMVYDVVALMIELLDAGKPLSDKEKKILRISAILHDIGKEKEGWQEAIRTDKKVPSHIDEDLSRKAIIELSKIIKIEDSQAILNCICLHMKATQTTGNIIKAKILEPEIPNWKELQDFIDSADNLASCGNVLEAVELLENPQRFKVGKLFEYSYHHIYLRGVSSVFLHKACQSCYQEKGWKPVLYFLEGTIYLSVKILEKIGKEEIANKLEEIINESIETNAKNMVVPDVIMDNTAIPRPELFDNDEMPLYLKKVKGRKNPSNYQKFLKKINCITTDKIDDFISKDSIFKEILESYKFNIFWKNHVEAISKSNIKKNEIYKNEMNEITKNLLSDPISLLMILKTYSEDIISAQNEVAIFKFFKAAISKEIWKTDISDKIEKNYNYIFGDNSFKKLQSMSNNDYPHEMAYSIYLFWKLEISEIINYIGNDNLKERISNFSTVGKLKPIIRKEVLCEILLYIWNQIEEENKPERKIANKMANDFLFDIQYPVTDYFECKLQLENYGESKQNSKREAGIHLCPICNSKFNRGKLSTADIVSNPEGFTNRARSHGKAGKIVICEKCRSEIYLKQILLNGRSFNKTIFLIPQFNLSNQIGIKFLEAIDNLRQKTENLMSEFSTNSEQIPDLSKTTKIALNVINNINKIETKKLEDYIITGNSQDDVENHIIEELLKYNEELPLKKDEEKALLIINKEFEKNYEKFKDFVTEMKQNWQFREKLMITKKNPKRSEIDEALINYFGNEFPLNIDFKKSLEMLNDDFVTDYKDWGTFIEDFKLNKIESKTAHDIVKRVYRLIPKYQIIAQTPNFAIIPLKQSLRWSDDSDINGCIRELFISIIFARKLNCSVAIADNISKIDIEQRKGSVYVPENPLLRQLTSDSWLRNYNFLNEKGINVDSDEKWLIAIASALRLSYMTNYSDRTNLFEILRSKTKGHLLRRIEMQEEKVNKKNKGRVSYLTNPDVYIFIENIWEVRK